MTMHKLVFALTTPSELLATCRIRSHRCTNDVRTCVKLLANTWRKNPSTTFSRICCRKLCTSASGWWIWCTPTVGIPAASPKGRLWWCVVVLAGNIAFIPHCMRNVVFVCVNATIYKKQCIILWETSTGCFFYISKSSWRQNTPSKSNVTVTSNSCQMFVAFELIVV